MDRQPGSGATYSIPGESTTRRFEALPAGPKVVNALEKRRLEGSRTGDPAAAPLYRVQA
jgi:hypothetical protein